MTPIYYNHLTQTEKNSYKAANGRGCYLFHLKNDGSKYKHADFYDYVGFEKSPEDVIARLERLNPGAKWVVA